MMRADAQAFTPVFDKAELRFGQVYSDDGVSTALPSPALTASMSPLSAVYDFHTMRVKSDRFLSGSELFDDGDGLVLPDAEDGSDMELELSGLGGSEEHFKL